MKKKTTKKSVKAKTHIPAKTIQPTYVSSPAVTQNVARTVYPTAQTPARATYPATSAAVNYPTSVTSAVRAASNPSYAIKTVTTSPLTPNTAHDVKNDLHPVNIDLKLKMKKTLNFCFIKFLFVDILLIIGGAICIMINDPKALGTSVVTTINTWGYIFAILGIISFVLTFFLVIVVLIHYHVQKNFIKSANSPKKQAEVAHNSNIVPVIVK
ncbi:MAG: hypothetical protein LBS95_03045 [Mycoplasmataceae bacterium]|jgi:uncharacterized membrane protein (DUF485 family)|nr:hypothetical protein [Mycoplasmataceae bacterium]